MDKIALYEILLTIDGCGLTSSVTGSIVNYMYGLSILVICVRSCHATVTRA